jgi:hypothetical protein
VTAVKPIFNDRAGEWHRARFAEFCVEKAAVGEPTPHMTWVTWLTKDMPEAERLWFAGCYLDGYSVLTGEAIQREWSSERFRAERDEFLPWLKENWAGIHTRTPRRCVRTPEAFYRCLSGYFDWTQKELPELRGVYSTDPKVLYNYWWDSATAIPFYGRYLAIRLLELYRRWGYVSAPLHDIRAVGAHSPVRCLMLLRPDAIEELASGETATVDRIAAEVWDGLRAAEGLADLSAFTFATLLCEYRSAWEDRGDGAGHQTDEELEYTYSKYAQYWTDKGYTSRLFEARAATTPHEALGEIQGWVPPRKLAYSALRDHGVVWSDRHWDWFASEMEGMPVAHA